MSPSSSTQIVVIGAGPGGNAAAFYAADRGLQVTLVDPEQNPGGVCLYRGCIPSKALLHVAQVVNEAKHADAWGISFGAPTIDVDKVRAFKERVVAQLTGGVGQIGRMRKITYIQGLAEIRDARTLRIRREGQPEGKDAGDTLAFEHAIIATGSRPSSVPGLSIDSSRVMDSTAALDLPDIPKSLLVVGGGYIGLELGTVYAALGSKVTVVEMTSGLLPGADRDLVNVLARRVESMCDAVLLNTKVVSMKEEKDGVSVTFEGQLPEGMASERTFDRVLISVGRRPNSAIPGLDRTAVKVKIHGQESRIIGHIDRSKALVEFYAVVDAHAVRLQIYMFQMQVSVAIEDAARGPSLVHQPRLVIEKAIRIISDGLKSRSGDDRADERHALLEVFFCANSKLSHTSPRGDFCRWRFFGIEGNEPVDDTIDVLCAQFVLPHELVTEHSSSQQPHLDCVFHHLGIVVEFKAAVPVRNRNDTLIDFGTQTPVEADFLATEMLSLF